MAILLAHDVVENIDISSEAEVLRFTYIGTDPATIIARMIVSGGSAGITGGLYYPLIYINDIVVSPVYPVQIAPDTQFMVSTRADIIFNGDVVSLRLIGLPEDVSVTVESHVTDTAHLSDKQIQELIKVFTGTLGKVAIYPERVILSPIRPCVKTFTLPKKC